MALSGRLKPALPLLPLLPALVFPPLLIQMLGDLHGGGLTLLSQFVVAAFQPSLDPTVLSAQVTGLQITLITALLSWSLSCVVGVLLGLISSRTIWVLVSGTAGASRWISRLLSPLRSLHELIWGLLLLQIFGLSSWVAVMAIALPYAALMARVVADQIDSRDIPAMKALRSNGAGTIPTLITALLPSFAESLSHHMAHRLECALRSALLLGVFGLGGLGTDLALSMQSLQFNELWSGLWLLAMAMGSLEVLTHRLGVKLIGALILLAPGVGAGWGRLLAMDLSLPQLMLPLTDLSGSGALNAAIEALPTAPWLTLIGSTIWLTALAAAVAIGGPPLGLLLWPGRYGVVVQRVGWGLMRLFPPPLTALLLLLLAKPSLGLAAIALGLHHLGVMGRVLQDELDSRSNATRTAMQCSGASQRLCWLYGDLAGASRSYLAYAAYRMDVILRDTAVVALVGGAGLGWQLRESLTSFHWALVIWLVLAYALLTMAGEMVSERLQNHWACEAGGL
jgi:phosphonate transport system permease protein